MSQLTGNTTAFVEAEQYSQFILDNMHDYLLPAGMYRDVSDFGSGTTLNIKTVGTVTLQDSQEDTPLVFNPIDTGSVTLGITNYVGDAWRVSDDLREDGSQIDTLMAMRALESTRALGEKYESDFLASSNSSQAAGLNLVNNRPHRWIGGGAGATTRTMDLTDFISMKLAFDKANVPAGGRIAIVDPVVEASLNSITNLVNVSNNPQFEGIITEGFARDHKFVKNIFGFDVYTSNFLAVSTATEALNGATYNLANTTSAVGDVANVFMSVADDNAKPIMHAWRRQPKTEGWRDSDNRGDKFQVTSRYGFGAQRLDTLGVILTSASAY